MPFNHTQIATIAKYHENKPNNCVVLCAAHLAKLLNENETKKTFLFKLTTPTIPQNIALAAGPFEVSVLSLSL
jgi:hypothetical protein